MLRIALLALALLAPTAVFAAASAPSSYPMSVTICDWANPSHCSQPDASGNIPFSDAANVAFQGAVAMTVGTTYTAQRSVGVNCTVAGNVVLVLADASTITIPVAVGWTQLPFAATAIQTSGTTATATYYNLK